MPPKRVRVDSGTSGHEQQHRQSGILRVAREMRDGLLDLIYPSFCLVCGSGGADYLCGSCTDRIELITPPFCSVCGMPCEPGRCPDCAGRTFAFEIARSVGVFDGVLRDAIHAFKYGPRIVLAEPLADLMVRWFPETRLEGRFDVVTAIPVHRTRIWERGFNQADELARHMCSRLGLTYLPDVLERSKPGKRQVELPYGQRTANIRGAFHLRDASPVTGKRVLLVDDVFTTGSTLDEASETLLDAGCTGVVVYTLARSVR